MNPTLTIGKLARAASVGVETIRYYQQRGLLATPAAVGSFRHYPASDIERIRFIKRAQELGFTLEEIVELLRLQDGTDRAQLRRLAAAKRDQIAEKLVDLQRMHQVLEHLVQACVHTDATHPCPIIDSLTTASSTEADFLQNRSIPIAPKAKTRPSRM